MELHNQKLVMIESKAYYEAYVHVLKQLKTMRTISFEKMIVGGDYHQNS